MTPASVISSKVSFDLERIKSSKIIPFSDLDLEIFTLLSGTCLWMLSIYWMLFGQGSNIILGIFLICIGSALNTAAIIWSLDQYKQWKKSQKEDLNST